MAAAAATACPAAGGGGGIISRLSDLPHHSRKQSSGPSVIHGRRVRFFVGAPIKDSSPNGLLLFGTTARRRMITPIKRLTPVMQWVDCSAEIEIDVPASVAYEYYSDRESIPLWTPFISSVKVLKNNPDLSRWSMKYQFLGQDLEFSWLARNLRPIRNQKIHWVSLEGLPNRGSVRFYPRGPTSCKIELTTSYEVPQFLIPVASALKSFLEEMLHQSLGKFAIIAKNRKSEMSRS